MRPFVLRIALSICLLFSGAACQISASPTSDPTATTSPTGAATDGTPATSSPSTGSLSGSVVFSDKDQHEGIQVALLGSDRLALTDATGKFRIRDVPPGTYMVLVTHEAHLGRRVDDVAITAGQETTLPTQVLQPDPKVAQASLHGRVQVPGTADAHGTLVFIAGTGVAVFTDASGDFRLSGVPEGAQTLVARRAPFADKELDITVPATGSLEVGTLSLEPLRGVTGSISGAVHPVGAASKAGVTVYLAGTSISARSDASGRFSLSPVLPGRYELVAALPGYQTTSLPGIEVTAAQDVSLPELLLTPVGPQHSPFGRIVGRVRLETATSHAGAILFVAGTDRLARSDAAGAFVLDEVLPGDWTLQVLAPGFHAASQAVHVTAGADTVIDEWALSPVTDADLPVGVVTGRVTLDGAATGNAGITVALAGSAYAGVTDDAGAFTLRDVLPGSYELFVLHNGYARASVAGVVVNAGRTTTTATLDLVPMRVTGTISGTVRPEGAASKSGVTVYLAGTALSARSDADGRFTLSAVLPGRYELVAAAVGFRSSTVRDLEVVAGQSVVVPELVLQPVGPADSPFGRLFGRVRLGAAATQAGATLYLAGSDRTTYSDDAGSFTFDNLLPGDWTLHVLAPGFHTSSRTVRVTAGADTVLDEWSLDPVTSADRPVGELTGRVRLGGAVSGNAGITVALEGTSYAAFTDDEGMFTLRDVEPGAYTLMAMRSGYRKSSVAGITVRAGQSTTAAPLDLVSAPLEGGGGGDIRGRALLVGQPDQSGTTVRLSGGSLAVPLETRTDASGAYAFVSVGAGIYEVTLLHPPYQPVSLQNVVSQVGTFRVPDATLYLGAKVDPLPFARVQLSPDEGRAVVSLASASGELTFAYDLKSRTLKPLVGQGVTVSAWSSDGRSAIVSTNSGSVLFADLALATVAPVYPASVGPAFAAVGEDSFYRTSTGEVRRVRAGTSASVLLSSGCGDGWLDNPFGGLANDQVIQLSCNGWGGYGNLLADPVTLEFWGDFTWTYRPTGSTKFVGGTVSGDLVWVDPEQHRSRRLATGLSPSTVSDGSMGGRYAEHTSNLLPVTLGTGASTSLGVVDVSAGLFRPVANGTSWAGVVASGLQALARVPAAGGQGLSVVRFDTGADEQICVITWDFKTAGDLTVCKDEADGHLYAYRHAARSRQDLGPIVGSTEVSADGSTVVWADGSQLKSWRPSASLGVDTHCEKSLLAGGDSEYGLSPDGTLWAGTCGVPLRLVEIDLEASTHRELTSPDASHYICKTSSRKSAWLCQAGAGYGYHEWIWSAGIGEPSVARVKLDNSFISERMYWSDEGDGVGVVLHSKYSGQWFYLPIGVVDGLPVIGVLMYSYQGPGGVFVEEKQFSVSRGGRKAMNNYGQVVTLVDGTVTRWSDYDRTRIRIGSSEWWLNSFSDFGFGCDGCRQRFRRFSMESGDVSEFDGQLLTFDTEKRRLCFTDDRLHCVDATGSDVVLATGYREAGSAGPNASERLVLVHHDGFRGDLKLLDATDHLVDIASGVAQLDQSTTIGRLVFTNVDLTTGLGTLVSVNGPARTATKLADGVRISAARGVQQNRVYFNGTDANGPGFFVVRLDGTGLRRLGPESASWFFSPDGSRALFAADGYTWAEDTTGGPSLVLEKNYGNVAATRNGRTLFFNATTDVYPDSTRNGSYRVDLP